MRSKLKHPSDSSGTGPQLTRALLPPRFPWAEGDLDFHGTLGVDKEAPVGFKAIRPAFDRETDAPENAVARLIRLTERCCVFYQTLNKRPLAAGDREPGLTGTPFPPSVAPRLDHGSNQRPGTAAAAARSRMHAHAVVAPRRPSPSPRPQPCRGFSVPALALP